MKLFRHDLTEMKIVLMGVFVMSSQLICSNVFAQPSSENPPRRPPPEALEACKSLASGQECGFKTPDGNIAGLCWAPEGKPLACKPKDAPAQESKKNK